MLYLLSWPIYFAFDACRKFSNYVSSSETVTLGKVASGILLLSSAVLFYALFKFLCCSFLFSRKRNEAEEEPSLEKSSDSCSESESDGNFTTEETLSDDIKAVEQVNILYGTQTGKSKYFAETLAAKFRDKHWVVEVTDLKDIDPEENLLSKKENGGLCLFIVSTYTDGKCPENCSWFFKWLNDASYDFRVSKTTLSGLRFCILGLGNSLYRNNFNLAAIELTSMLANLGASQIIPTELANENTAESKTDSLEAEFETWSRKVFKFLTEGKQEEGKPSTEFNLNSDDFFEDTSEDEAEDEVMDVEELGSMVQKMKKPQEVKEMVTPLLRKELTKQGYKLIGTHSGVKLCRWTKSMLRGRGGCYKHTFYGIESHRCMETTPSLACANKCVFCWRHHSNPVGTEWKWKMDPADVVFEGALKNHYQMIKEYKGVPGVLPARLAEGFEVKHCALSLVGEPIMYPEINKFIDLLHGKHISSFLVTNAQFPEEIRTLNPVTQLYVSIDASNKESLKKIDRPLFRDFWDRFLNSLKALSAKGQRTVYRLTLVKAWNTDEMQGYADLVALGNPDFIEIKGVTYCGTSKASTLTMNNVPWHEEVVSFVQQLADLLPNYGIASEHEHSNCVLLANKKFLVNGDWWTWIDYEMFHNLITDYNKSGKSFTSLDYMAKSPKWATYGADEMGFDPVETRFKRKNRKDISGC